MEVDGRKGVEYERYVDGGGLCLLGDVCSVSVCFAHRTSVFRSPVGAMMMMMMRE